MSGNKNGGFKVRDILTKDNPDYYRELGKQTMKNGRKPGGFHGDRERARIIGAKGGRMKGINHKKRLAERAKLLANE